MTPKDTKKPKKPLPKKPRANGPQIKVIEISLSKLAFPIFGIILLLLLAWNFRGFMSDEKIVLNQKIGLNEIVANYNS